MQKNSNLISRISSSPKQRQEIFNVLSLEEKASILLRLSKRVQLQLMSSIADDELVAVLEHLDPDEVADMVQMLPKGRKEKVVQGLQESIRSAIEILERFDPLSAAGLMNLDYIQVEIDESFSEVAQQFRVHEKRTGRLPLVIAMEDGKLKGYIPVHQFAMAAATEKVGSYVAKVLTVQHNDSHRKVTEVFTTNPHSRVVVLGENGNVIGIIYSDDILQLLRKRETGGLYDFAGVSEEESVTDPASYKIRSRYKWLIINLGTAFLAAFTIGAFEETLAKYVVLAMYMPIVAGMGGNAATQTLAVVVRGISLHQITLGTVWFTIRRELIAALVNGFINGLIVAAIVLIFNRDAKLALVLSVAMIFNLLVAAFFGTLIPLIMQRLGKDPAASATIFITTATDVLGFMAFLGLASVVLGS